MSEEHPDNKEKPDPDPNEADPDPAGELAADLPAKVEDISDLLFRLCIRTEY
jgi:hypothetical protein